MAEKQLDKLVTNVTHALDEYKFKREHLLIDFLRQDTVINAAPSNVTLVDNDSFPSLKSSNTSGIERTIDWVNIKIEDGKITSIGNVPIYAPSNDIWATDYDTSVLGVRDGLNTLFGTTANYKPNTARVYLNGLRLQPGNDYDYIESGPNSITFNFPILLEDSILIDYIKL